SHRLGPWYSPFIGFLQGRGRCPFARNRRSSRRRGVVAARGAGAAARARTAQSRARGGDDENDPVNFLSAFTQALPPQRADGPSAFAKSVRRSCWEASAAGLNRGLSCHPAGIDLGIGLGRNGRKGHRNCSITRKRCVVGELAMVAEISTHEPTMSKTGHAPWVRLAHWVIAASVLTLVFSGFEIL